MQHDYETAATCGCDNPYCPVCVGGIGWCRVCGAYEGGLTTECPGRQTTAAETDAVYHGRIDFRGGAWVDGVTSHMAHAYPERRDLPARPLTAEELARIIAEEEARQ